MMILFQRLPALWILSFLFVLSPFCKAESSQTSNPKGFLEDKVKLMSNEGNGPEIENDVYDYFLPFLKEQKPTHEFNYDYYDSEYPDYYSYDDETDIHTKMKSDVGSQMKLTDATTENTDVIQVTTETTEKALGTTEFSKRMARQEIAVQKLCLQPEKQSTVTKRLLVCPQNNTFEPACVGPNNLIGICKEFVDFSDDPTPICVRKEELSYVVVCSHSGSEELCFFERNDTDRMIPCKDKHRGVCVLEDGDLEYCQA